MKHVFMKSAVLASAALVAGSTGLFAGEPAPYLAPPAAPSDCSGCTNPGFYVEGELLYLNSYRAGGGYDGDWDLGYRASAGFENASGLFAEITGFYYQGDYSATGNIDGEVDFYYLDFTVGDTVHCGELCVAINGGLRYGGFEDNYRQGVVGAAQQRRSYEFDGWGPTIEIEATRAITEQFALYAELRQSILFGEGESKATGQNTSSTSDTIGAVTEIGAGLQANFTLGAVDAYVRAGFEGQYWHIDDSDHGLWGGVLKVGGRF